MGWERTEHVGHWVCTAHNMFYSSHVYIRIARMYPHAHTPTIHRAGIRRARNSVSALICAHCHPYYNYYGLHQPFIIASSSTNRRMEIAKWEALLCQPPERVHTVEGPPHLVSLRHHLHYTDPDSYCVHQEWDKRWLYQYNCSITWNLTSTAVWVTACADLHDKL